MKKLGTIALTGLGVVGMIVACGGNNNSSGFDDPTGGSDGGNGGPPKDEAGNTIGFGGEGGTGGEAGLPPGETRDPVDCNEAKTSKSYVGCDYWPTVTANNVWSIFDYAVVVSNVGMNAANITVTGGALTGPKTTTVQPGALAKIYLPWVPELKGPDTNECGAATPLTASVVKTGGAYHLVSTSPVIVYQFNALEYKGAGGENADGGTKDWSTCIGSTKKCDDGQDPPYLVGCFSFSNDASLLLPSTAMTNNYRVLGHEGWTEQQTFLGVPTGNKVDILGSYVTVTATQDGTNVTATLASTAKVLGGGAITATTGGTLKFTLANAGDVAEIVLDKGDKYDLSGSLIQSDKPIQVIAGVPCINVPEGQLACDHIEESIMPAETLGKHYVVSMPDKPAGGIGKAVIKFYGNQDGTNLTYNPSGAPAGCPTTLNAGQVVECKLGGADFEVTGDKEFGVAEFTPGATVYSGMSMVMDPPGDPDESIFPAVEQFRTKYLFLAPTDYDTSYVDIVGTSDAAPVLDGKPVSAAFTMIGSGPFGTWRVTLDAGPKMDGAHSLTSTKPVGIQVMGYGGNTSYQYPGGLNLNLISAPPPPPK
jgi:hypothetical protein